MSTVDIADIPIKMIKNLYVCPKCGDEIHNNIIGEQCHNCGYLKQWK